MSPSDDDEALVGAALSGSARAWEQLVRRYESRIYNHGLRLMGNPTDAMDLMQEVFLGIYRNLHRFRGDAKFSSWIFRIAHNKAVDMSRRKRLFTNQAVPGSEGEEDFFDAQSGPDSAEPDKRLSELETNRQVMAMLGKLPLEQRLVVELKIYQSLTFDEIAVLQEISVNTAKTRFYSALRKLRTDMEEDHVLP